MLAIFMVLMILAFALQSLFTRLYAAAYPLDKAGQTTHVFSICYGLFIALASLIVGGFSFAPSWQTVLLALLTAVSLIIYNSAMIEAGNRGSYSFLMIASMFGAMLVPMFVGVCFLGEKLASHQIIAVVLMLLSLVLMNVRGIQFKGNSKAYYFWCIALFISNGVFGTLMNLQTEVMEGAQRTEMLTILYAVSAIVSGGMGCAKGNGKKLMDGFRMGKKAGLYLLLCCACATAAANLMLYVLSQMDSAIVYTITDGSVLVVSFLFSLVLFKERPRWEQLLGMALAAGSLVLINC